MRISISIGLTIFICGFSSWGWSQTSNAGTAKEVNSIDCISTSPLVQKEFLAVIVTETSLNYAKSWTYTRGQILPGINGISITAQTLSDTSKIADDLNLSEVSGKPISGPALKLSLGDGSLILVPQGYSKNIINRTAFKASWLDYDPHDLDEESTYTDVSCTAQTEYLVLP